MKTDELNQELADAGVYSDATRTVLLPHGENARTYSLILDFAPDAGPDANALSEQLQEAISGLSVLRAGVGRWSRGPDKGKASAIVDFSVPE